MTDHPAPGARTRVGGPSFGERRLAEETRERFLREIVARVPLDRLAAVHLFRPIRQGGFESGVAVVAAEPPAPEAPPEAPALAETPASDTAAAEAEAREEAVSADAPAADVEPGADAIAEPACDPTDAAALDAGDVDAGDLEAPPLDAAIDAAALADAEAPEGAELEPEPVPEPRLTRHTVFTARYRLAVKGPDRGKWDMEVVEEADAPLVTVEAVVRGVQRRAGDEGDPPERLDAAAVARLLGPPAGPPSPRPAAP